MCFRVTGRQFLSGERSMQLPGPGTVGLRSELDKLDPRTPAKPMLFYRDSSHIF